MNQTNPSCFHTAAASFRCGAMLGFLAALVYGVAFAIYAILRSSFQILSVSLPPRFLPGTLGANAVSILIAAVSISLLASIIPTLIQALTTFILYHLSALSNPHRTPVKAISLGIGISACISLIIGILFRQTTASYYPAFLPWGYLVWIGLPILIYICLSVWISWKINEVNNK